MVRARGRFKPGVMNKTEERYAAHLELLKRAGEVTWWRFGALKLRLADKTFYDTDFIVLKADGLLEVHEVKGHWEDDARVKVKVAADQYPFRFLALQERPKRDGGGWAMEEF